MSLHKYDDSYDRKQDRFVKTPYTAGCPFVPPQGIGACQSVQPPELGDQKRRAVSKYRLPVGFRNWIPSDHHKRIYRIDLIYEYGLLICHRKS